MRLLRLLAKPALLCLFVCASVGGAQDVKKADPKKDDKQVVDSKPEKRSSAAGIDFKKEYNLPFSSLNTIGSRIETARRAHDPVALAHLANELSTAEKVSTKKAPVTSTALMKEAAELAQMRREEKELEATLHMANQIAQEEGVIQNLKTSIGLAKAQTKSETDAILKMEEPTGPRKLLINNYTTQYVDIWVNGFLKVQVGPGQSRYCTIEHKWDPTILKAYGTADDVSWGPRYIWGNFKTYTWNLH